MGQHRFCPVTVSVLTTKAGFVARGLVLETEPEVDDKSDRISIAQINMFGYLLRRKYGKGGKPGSEIGHTKT